MPQELTQETQRGLIPGAITVTNANRIGLLRTLSVDGASAQSLAFSPDGQILAAGGEAGKVRLWRVEDGALVHTLENQKRRVNSVAFSPDGRFLASAAHKGYVQLWCELT